MNFFSFKTFAKVFFTAYGIFLAAESYAADVKILNDGKEALNVRIHLIDQAKSTIEMSYFIFEEDETGRLILARLLAAAQRGVKVKILVDHVFNKISPAYYTALKDNNRAVEIRDFNPSPQYLTRRMHNKIFLVDGHKAILGGRNIENTYYDQSPKGGKKNYDDRDIYIHSAEVGKKIQVYFYELWREDYVEEAYYYDYMITRAWNMDDITKALQEMLTINKAHRGGDYQGIASSELSCVDDEKITFAHDQVQFFKDSSKGTTKAIYDLIQNAKNFIYIDSPYFILTPKTTELFKSKIKEGVKIRLMTNSLQATDGLLPQAAYMNQKKQEILALGIEVYEYIGLYSFHSKSMVIDDRVAVIGSFNFDYISEGRNTETALILEDYELVQKLKNDMISTEYEAQEICRDGNLPDGSSPYETVPREKLRKTSAIQKIIPWIIIYL